MYVCMYVCMYVTRALLCELTPLKRRGRMPSLSLGLGLLFTSCTPLANSIRDLNTATLAKCRGAWKRKISTPSTASTCRRGRDRGWRTRQAQWSHACTKHTYCTVLYVRTYVAKNYSMYVCIYYSIPTCITADINT